MRGTTIRDVARRAGVSIATVSRVQRGSAPVADDTRDRVAAAIEALRYVPNRLGRGLAERRHRAMGIVFPDLSGPYFSEVIGGFETAATDDDHGVMVLSTHGREAAADRVRDLASRVDGLLILGRTVPDEVIRDLHEAGRPIVLLARPPVGDTDAVRAENRATAARLALHLIDVHGHRRIAFLGDPDSSPDGAERWDGFVAAHRSRGLAGPDGPIRSLYRQAEGYAAARLALMAVDAREPPTALFCGNDEIALGTYRAATELHRRVGHDLAITGWDDIPTARYLAPALTTVRQPMRELGLWAARALFARIHGGGGPPRHEVLPTQVVLRASCGCATTPMQEEPER
ncbi:MAG: LacI family transcriptional regulator [Chloroflexi bacterium]|nr:MAG: LacI family transcriptional regulator [Chloroflexota bacterium]